MNHDDHDDYPETYSDSIYGEPRRPRMTETPQRVPRRVVVAVLAGIVAFMVSALTSCTQVTAGWETAKSRTQFGVGFTSVHGNWYGPVTFAWLSEPKPEEQPRLNQEIEITEGEPPFSGGAR